MLALLAHALLLIARPVLGDVALAIFPTTMRLGEGLQGVEDALTRCNFPHHDPESLWPGPELHSLATFLRAGTPVAPLAPLAVHRRMDSEVHVLMPLRGTGPHLEEVPVMGIIVGHVYAHVRPRLQAVGACAFAVGQVRDVVQGGGITGPELELRAAWRVETEFFVAGDPYGARTLHRNEELVGFVQAVGDLQLHATVRYRVHPPMRIVPALGRVRVP
mmetsp:Transcript_143773/g.400738  ORF Transcript_143773/g.400738 Transcript_143773/m.400738 type:complete len:218 (-) Transcript_143773:381-1034(-)